jgi:hypothetical protein
MHPSAWVTDCLLAGSCASVSSTAANLWVSRLDTGQPAAGTNATSHWVRGDEAFAHDGVSGRYTGLGYAVHHLSSLVWSGVHAGVRRAGPDTSLARRCGEAVAVSALACFVDFVITPKRLTPGFEARLRPASIAIIYAAFAAGLLAATYALDRRGRRGGPLEGETAAPRTVVRAARGPARVRSAGHRRSTVGRRGGLGPSRRPV